VAHWRAGRGKVALCVATLLAAIVACDQLLGVQEGTVDGAADVIVRSDAARDAGGDAGGDAMVGPLDADAGSYCNAPIGDSGICDGAGSVPLDFGSNAKNCGRCGHDCLGGQCVGGICQPYDIAEITADANPLGPQVIAVLGGKVYFTVIESAGPTNVLMSVDTDGGTPVVLADGVGTLAADAVDESGVYFLKAFDANVYRVQIAGGTPQPFAKLTESAGIVGGIFLDATHVYVADGNNNTYLIPKATPGAPVVVSSATPVGIVGAPPLLAWQSEPYLFSKDATSSLYVDDFEDAGLYEPIGTGMASGLARDDSYFYWFESSTGTLEVLPRNHPAQGNVKSVTKAPYDAGSTGSTASVFGIAPQGPSPGAIVGVANAFGSDALFIAFCAGESPRVLYKEPDGVTGAHNLADDGVSLYWGAYNKSLRRMVK
jgi:hypothetical protein